MSFTQGAYDDLRTIQLANGNSPTLVMPKLHVGRAIGDRYVINCEVGHHGAMSPFHVYACTDMQTGWQVCVKTLNLRADVANGSYVERIFERFLREIRIMKQLNHVGIVPVIDFGHDQRWYWMVMPFYQNGTLMKFIEDRHHAPLAIIDACAYTIQMARALTVAHSQDPPIIHRDVKPHNMLFDDQGNLRIMDFGIAHILYGEHYTRADLAVGTPECMAPEQLQPRYYEDFEQIDPRTDIYQLGCCLYWMLCGHAPFSGSTPQAIALAHLQLTPKPLHTLNQYVTQGLALIVGKALEKYPEDRWSSMAEFADALAPFIEED